MKERRSPSSLAASVSLYNQPYRCSTTLDLTTLSASSTLLPPPPVVWRYCNEGIAFNREACSLSLKRAAVVVRSRYGQTITNPPIARIGTPGRKVPIHLSASFAKTCLRGESLVGKRGRGKESSKELRGNRNYVHHLHGRILFYSFSVPQLLFFSSAIPSSFFPAEFARVHGESSSAEKGRWNWNGREGEGE